MNYEPGLPVQMAVEQREGITMARVQEIVETVLHDGVSP
jgi:hypothetical protein